MAAGGSIRADPCLAAVSFEGNRDTAEVHCGAGILLWRPRLVGGGVVLCAPW